MQQKTAELVQFLRAHPGQFVKSREIKAALFPAASQHSAVVRWHISKAREAGVIIESHVRQGFRMIGEKI